ncbi:ABC transporter substrate-binding protein [Chelatococcus asaccharovorans]|uniref:Amino acid/amide ABC transporter substrate-binding protein (HAAT family) n=1 Tax=Chelatococcus asaccharovorans TaxID=28210 RepID=A0A2V3TUA5_9HYPH|nr:ABC transporter substrate-binding protein [Chelatococcus asaccharovorans]MBS7704928.1 ABC transporter substrate-binding protein [Chelatococcus asaccharovorans]PXW51391.1 amino acid/amide ABC transporter substrate-binding protein (HAAT family) [Chelatococcus asaccharovorans]
MTMRFTRRSFLGTSILAAGTLAMPAILRAQEGPIKLGTLTPLTGSGGAYGPVMADVVKKAAGEINKAGGVLGRELVIISEDDQTNPEAGLRAARKLIDVDKVSAIMGTWASSVTTAVAPVCWQSGVFLATVSGADSITKLPHQGFIIRTQPNTTLQGRKFGEFALELGAKNVAFVSPQTPFTESQFAALTKAVEAAGGKTSILIYDDKKTTLRTEVDQVLRSKPDAIVMGGYTTDTAVLVRDLYRANYKGKLLGFGYAVNKQLVEALPPDVSEGIVTLSPSAAQGTGGYKNVARLLGVDSPDTYSCQIYDHLNLISLAMAAGKGTTGTVIKDNVRKVAQGGGQKVDNAVDGLKLVTAGTKIDYDGASGPCDFTDIGDIEDAQFRYEQIKDGKIVLLKIA